MNQGTDGYELYRLFSDGEAHDLELKGSRYRFLFRGHRTGANNWLEATAEDGESKQWGWGWNSEVCWNCLGDLEQGWGAPRKHPYKPYGNYGYDDD
jgi:hypothetical protein